MTGWGDCWEPLSYLKLSDDSHCRYAVVATLAFVFSSPLHILSTTVVSILRALLSCEQTLCV